MGTSVTDRGLPQLAELKQLRRLWLDGAQITEEGVGRLRRQLPEAEISY